MLGTNSLISKTSCVKALVGEIGFKLISSELKQSKTLRNARFYYKMHSFPCRKFFANSFNNIFKIASFRHCSAPATAELKNGEVQQMRSYYQEILQYRKVQAHQSFLIEVAKKEHIPYAVTHCGKYGAIENVYSCCRGNQNYFLLLEFSDEDAGKRLLMNCKCKNIVDAFPVYSRLIGYKKIYETDLSEVRIIEESIPKSSLKPGASISEVIQDIYLTEKLTELETRLRYFFCALIKDSLSSDFPHCDVIPFGSSVNGLGRHGCDLDIMVRLYPEQENGNSELFFLNKICLVKHQNKTCVGTQQNYQQQAIHGLGEYIRAFLPGAFVTDKIIFARVPILKIKHSILNIDCDLSVNNMSAVHMSNVLHFCGEIDARVRPLMYAVKKWAKEAGITRTPQLRQIPLWISNFGLVNLVIFFLQNRPHPILPPLKNVFVIVGEENSVEFGVQFLKPIEELKNDASLNKESLAVLLKEFLSFLVTEPFQENIISFMTGKKRPRPHGDSIPLWLQYPFDEKLNITKNVCYTEFEIMRDKARMSARHLEGYLKQNKNTIQDFSTLLGIPSVIRIGTAELQKINVNSLMENKNSKSKTIKHRTL